MSFKVDTASLEKFADLLMHYYEDAGAIRQFFKKKTEMSLREEGIYRHLVAGHDSNLEMMSDRIDLMRRIGLDSYGEMMGAVNFYDCTEAENEARLDATYDKVAPHKDDKARKGPPEKVNFKHLDAQAELEITKKASDLEPKGYAVDTWLRSGFDMFSLTAQVRTVINLSLGFDPIDWVRSWMWGDWEVWAKASLVWAACAESTKVMGENLWSATAALDEAWDGRAGDAAVAYFEQLRDATFTEAVAYEGLSERYALYMEFVYENQLLLNDLLNTIIDLAIELALVVTTAPASLAGDSTGTTVMAMLAIVSEIGMIYTIVVDACRLFETICLSNPVYLPEVPESELKEPKGDKGPGYEHPDPDVVW